MKICAVEVCAGNIPAEEMRFVLRNLPGGLSDSEVHQMINTVDRNNDGRIRNKSYLKHLNSFNKIVECYK